MKQILCNCVMTLFVAQQSVTHAMSTLLCMTAGFTPVI